MLHRSLLASAGLLVLAACGAPADRHVEVAVVVSAPEIQKGEDLLMVKLVGVGQGVEGLERMCFLDRAGPQSFRGTIMLVDPGEYVASLWPQGLETRVVVKGRNPVLNLRLPEAFHVRLKILDGQTGRPQESADVSWWALSDIKLVEEDEEELEDSRKAAFDSATGIASITAPPCEISVSISACGFLNQSLDIPLTLDGRAERTVRLQRSARVRVKVTSGGQPVPDMVSVKLEPVSDPDALGATGLTRRGEATLEGFGPGRFVLTVEDPAGDYPPPDPRTVEIAPGKELVVTVELGALPPAVLGARMKRQVDLQFEHFGLERKVAVGAVTIETRSDGPRLALPVRFLKKEGYRLDDVLRVAKTLEAVTDGGVVTALDFGRQDEGPYELWRLLSLRIVKEPFAHEQSARPTSVIAIHDQLQDVLRVLRLSAPGRDATRLTRLRIEPGLVVCTLQVPDARLSLADLREQFQRVSGFRKLESDPPTAVGNTRTFDLRIHRQR